MSKIFYKREDVVFDDFPKNGRVKNIVGTVFSRLTIIGFAGMENNTHSMWYCECNCGNIVRVYRSSLKNGKTKSCGCLNSDTRTIHGHTIGGIRSSEYRSWEAMIDRVNNPKNQAFHNYGGRGITVCERWIYFENFLEDMGERPEGMTIDRYPDNDGNYCPENCRWATPVEQCNNRRSSRFITHNNQTKTLVEWERHTGISSSVICSRIARGWDIEKCLETPIRITK